MSEKRLCSGFDAWGYPDDGPPFAWSCGCGEGGNQCETLAAAAEALLTHLTPVGPCGSCEGTGWVEDKNWHPEFVGETRRGGSGFLVCGSCEGEGSA